MVNSSLLKNHRLQKPLTGTEGQSVEAVPAAVEGNQPNGSNPSAPEAAAETGGNCRR